MMIAMPVALLQYGGGSMRLTLAAWLAAALLVSGCSSSSSTAPSSTTTTSTTIADPTSTENFNGTLAVGGKSFYSFTIAQNGTVNVTLLSVSGAGVPSTAQVGLSIGNPSGTDCTILATVTTGAGSAVQLTGTYAPNLYCVKIYDVGNLIAPVTFAITIAHP
jgi:hypothetical protein